MKETKVIHKYFSVPEWEKEEAFLRKQHSNGWRFIKVTGLGTYHFDKCVPEDVIYQLDYNSACINDRKHYIGMFSDCGWEYLQDFFGYSYFRKSVSKMNNGEENIFSDDDSKMDMIKRTFRGRVIPLILIFFCCIIPQLMMNLNKSSKMGTFIAGMLLAVFILYLVLFIKFGVAYARILKRTRK